MRCPVFRGIGGVANKYYLLFQHHLAPPVSSYTTGEEPLTRSRPSSSATTKTWRDDLQNASKDGPGGPDPRQLENTFVLEEKTIDSSYIIGSKPGVRSLLCFLEPANFSIAICCRPLAQYLCSTWSSNCLLWD
jgi:hypothetical protein